MKRCVLCGLYKSEDEFYANDKKCKVCRRQIVAKNRQKNIDYYREYDRNRPNKIERIKKNKERLVWLKEHDYERYKKWKVEANKKWRKKKIIVD